MNIPRETIKIPHYKHPADNGFFLRRLSDGHSMPDKRFQPHRDDYYIFLVLTSGTASGMIDFKRVDIQKNQSIIISPNQVHFIEQTETDIDGWVLAISAEHLSAKDIDKVAAYALNISSFDLEKYSADLANLFSILQRRIHENDMAKTLGSSIKSIILDCAPKLSFGTKNRYLRIVVELNKLIERNIISEKKPSAYASMLNISEVYLNEAVKATTGKNVSSFIRSKIILTAKRKMTYTSLSVKEIAYTLGYEDYPYFSRLFKKETGIAPMEFRKTLNSPT